MVLMPTYSLTSQRQRALFLPIAGLLGASLFGCPHSGNPTSSPITPASPDYAKAISAFYVGEAALESGDDEHAPAELTQFTQMVPQEPSGWADLGLYYLRHGQIAQAAPLVKKAVSLIPANQSAPFLMIDGLLESTQGNTPKAIADYQQVTNLEPNNLVARWALAQEIERQNSPDADTQALNQVQNILMLQPDNLQAEIEQARLAAKKGDGVLLKSSLGRVAKRSAAWSKPASRAQFAQVMAQIAHPEALTVQLIFLKNVLQEEFDYAQSRKVLDPASNSSGDVLPGQPILTLYKLATPAPTPAPADMLTSFSVEPLKALDASHKWAWVGAVSQNEKNEPFLLAADGHTVYLDGGATVPFPGGPGATPPSPEGVVRFDWNNDFRTDMALAGAGGIKLYQKQGEGGFRDVTAQSKLPADVLNAPAWGLWFADIDMDGDLDMVLAESSGQVRVLRNNGDGTFQSIAPFTGVSHVRSFVWADLNADGAPDAAFLDAQGQLSVFSNERSGQFLPWAVPTDLGKLRAISVGDIPGDGRISLIALCADGRLLRLTSKHTGKADRSDWEEAELTRLPAVSPDLKVGTARILIADLDNNGSVDIVVSGPTSTQVWLSDGKGGYASLGGPLAIDALAAVETTGNGRLNLVGLSPTGTPSLAANGTQKKDAYHWLNISPRANPTGTGDKRINSFAIGGEVRIRAGLEVQTQLIQSPLVHFGLGENATVDIARFVWPNGAPQAEFSLRDNMLVKTEQRIKSSCPWVFAYDGKSMRFAGDFLWRSPLGLRIDAQDTANVAMTREWLKIPGSRLAPRDGYYDIRITAELWETHFFDYVSLMTVDHPTGTDIWVDERFAIPPPPNKIYATTPLTPVVHAVDDRGTDVTDIVREQDDRYLDTFGRGEYQGITRDHYVEAEVSADAPRTGPLYLIATGWIHPTDSSINVAISQGKHDLPRGLSLEVADGKGGWVVAKPKLGFPAGKIKSIVIRLDDAFRPDAPRRFRLRTNLEIYWDSLATATGLPDATYKTQEYLPQSAELRYRGFSTTHQANLASPELPDYADLAATGQRWRDLIGYYTRYGDVSELLNKVDDRYVIMNAGDEMRFRFPVPPPPPPGWTRDFILVGDGWEKDGDLNTQFSKTVLPLPSHDNPAYNRPPGRLEDDPVYKRHPTDWQNYHTRYVTPDAFRDVLLRPKP